MSKESKTASHLPVLKLIYSIKPFNKVLEFGCGNYSTKYFASVCKELTSIEMDSKSWYEKIKKEVGGNIYYKPAEEALAWFKKCSNNYDLIFVDGAERAMCINASFNRAPVIALHDHGLKAARLGFFKRLDKYADYELIMINLEHPTTSLFVSDSYLKNALKSHEKYVSPIIDKWY